jgi:hypothetical protein
MVEWRESCLVAGGLQGGFGVDFGEEQEKFGCEWSEQWAEGCLRRRVAVAGMWPEIWREMVRCGFAEMKIDEDAPSSPRPSRIERCGGGIQVTQVPTDALMADYGERVFGTTTKGGRIR